MFVNNLRSPYPTWFAYLSSLLLMALSGTGVIVTQDSQNSEGSYQLIPAIHDHED